MNTCVHEYTKETSNIMHNNNALKTLHTRHICDEAHGETSLNEESTGS